MSISVLPRIDCDHSFELLYKIASLESYSLESSIPLLSKVTSTLAGIKHNFDKWLNKYDYIKEIDINKRKLEKKLKTYNYTDLREITVYKPIGLNVPYIKLIETVAGIQSLLLDIDKRLLHPYMIWTGEILNNPEKLERLNVNQVIEFLDTSVCNKTLDKLFDQNDVNSIGKYGKLFESNTQVLEVMNKTNDIIKLQNKLPPKDLMRMVDNASKRTEMFIRRCVSAKDSPLCSDSSKKVIADVLYDMGVEVTLYSRLSYNIISTQTALQDSFEKIISMG